MHAVKKIAISYAYKYIYNHKFAWSFARENNFFQKEENPGGEVKAAFQNKGG